MKGGRLLDDGANTTSTNDGPDEEGNAGGGDEVSLDGEEVADRVNGEPDGGQ